MIKIEVQSTRAVIRSQEPLTVGLQGAKVQFSFGQDWKDLTKTAVFRQGEVVRTVANVGQEATIPWEVLTVPGVPVEIGIYGIGQGKAIPTLWTTTQPVRPGADPQGDPSKEPTPGLWEQMQSQLSAMEEAVTEVQEQPRSLIVTVIPQPDGTYIADCDPEQIKKAVEDQWILGCYWYDKDMMLSLSVFQPIGPYTFTAVYDATEYRVLISQSGVVTCSETDLWDSSVKVTVTEQSDGTYTADLSHEQLLEAYNNGKILFCLYHGKIMPLVVASKPQMVFGCVYSGQVYTVTVGISRVTVKTVSLASNEESVLYTPQTLTPEQQAQARQNLGLDDLPTGGGSNYRLIAKIVFDGSNQTKYIKITQDMDGNPLELTNVVIYADWLAAANRADCNIKLNNIGFPWFFNLEQTAYKNILEAEMFEDLCYIHYYSKIAGTSKAEGSGVRAINIPGMKINEIVWSTSGVNPPPNGSTFAVYGY